MKSMVLGQKMGTLLCSVMQYWPSIIIACLTVMSKRCLSSHHKRLSVYNSAAMHIKNVVKLISCDLKYLYVAFERKVSSIKFFCTMMGLAWILIMGYQFENWKDFGSVVLHNERHKLNFGWMKHVLCTFWIVSLVVTHSDNEKIMFISE